MSLKTIIGKISKKPRNVFLIDAYGAFLTTFFMGIFILFKSQLQVGMPSKYLFILAFMAAIFCVYSFLCSYFVPDKWQLFLKIIVLSNSLYCFLIFGILLFFYNQLSVLELIYFSGELLILIFLILFELKVMREGI